jgi:hypothetical protein
MQVEISTPEEVVMRDAEFAVVRAAIDLALNEGSITTDPVNGWGEHIRVDVYCADWMRPWIEKIYAKAGWDTIVFKFIDRVMFMIAP